MNLKVISKAEAYSLIFKFHYSKVMPRLTKHYLGFYENTELIGVITLGWGTRPLHTIKKLFPELTSKDYYEIGKMCFDDKMPRNTESQAMSMLVKWLKKEKPQLSFLFTWADGIVGKVGYVYQACNFLYGGFILTDIYLSHKGEKIHPRSSKSLCKENAIFSGKEKIFWLTYDFCQSKGIKRIRGKQFKYIYPLNKQAMRLINKNWSREYPKEKDLLWKEQTKDGYKITGKPEMNLSVVDYNTQNILRQNRQNTLNFT